MIKWKFKDKSEQITRTSLKVKAIIGVVLCVMLISIFVADDWQQKRFAILQYGYCSMEQRQYEEAIVAFGILGRFAIFNYFTTESVRIAVLLDKFLCTQFCTDFFKLLICCFDRIFHIRNVLLEVVIVKQIIFGKIVERAGGFFQIIEFCPSLKSFPVAGCDIRGDIDIEACLSGQMFRCFCFITVFLQTGTDIFFRIIISQ